MAAGHPKLDRELNSARSGADGRRSIVTFKPGVDGSADVMRLGGRSGKKLTLINGQAVELSNGQLKKLADNPNVLRIDFDRPTHQLMATVSTTVGARAVQQTYGYDGSGVGVAVIDSGITSWHDDLSYNGIAPNVKTAAGQRVAAFMDFVNGQTSPYDDNGHGTHVAGIIAGNGYDSGGARAGIAPAAHIVSLKVLDADGRGVISDVIAAFDYAVSNRARLQHPRAQRVGRRGGDHLL